MRIIFLNSWFSKLEKELFNFLSTEKQKTDTFCLSEVSPENFKDFSKLLSEFDGFYTTDNKLIDLNYIYGQAIFVKKNIKILNLERINTFRNVFDDVGFLQTVNLKVRGKKMLIANVHGKARPGHKLDTPARLRQSRIIINALKIQNCPKLVGGDFNLMPNTKSVKIFEESGYRNLIKEFDIMETRNRLAWETHKSKPGFVKQHFADYCFVSKDIKVKNFTVPKNEVSDHLPLILDFEI